MKPDCTVTSRYLTEGPALSEKLRAILQTRAKEREPIWVSRK